MGITDWSAPSSGGTVGTASSTPTHMISHAGDYWFSVAVTSAGVPAVRYTTDPSATWSTATLPAAPAGYTVSGVMDAYSGVISDGTTYALALGYLNGSLFTSRFVHCTDPSGTWSSYQYDATDDYTITRMAYADGTWAATGYYDSGAGKRPAFIGYSSTINGTWTFGTATSATGYDVADVNNSRGRWYPDSLVYDGSAWTTSARPSHALVSTGTLIQKAYSATTLTGTWSAVANYPTDVNYYPLRYANSHYTVEYLGGEDVKWASALGGSWTQLENPISGNPSGSGGFIYGVDWWKGYWLIAGALDPTVGNDVPRVAYLASTGSPAGSYTAIGAGFTEPGFNVRLRGIATFGDYAVAGSDYYGELRYCRITDGPTYLRRRQSPAYTPSRVRGVDLRQSQTPRITR